MYPGKMKRGYNISKKDISFPRGEKSVNGVFIDKKKEKWKKN